LCIRLEFGVNVGEGHATDRFKTTSILRLDRRLTTGTHHTDAAAEDAVSLRNFVAASAARGFRATHCRTGVP